MCIPLPVWVLAVGGLVIAIVAVGYALTRGGDQWTTVGGVGRLMGIVAIVVLLALVSLSSLDGILARTHVPNIADKGLETATGVVGAFRSGSEHLELPERWASWQETAGRFRARPAQVLECYLDIDSLIFIPAYAFLLAAAFARALKKSKWGAAQGRTLFERSMGIVLLVSVGADQIENVYLDWAVRVPLEEGDPTRLLPNVLRILVFAKWAGVLFFVVFGVAAPALIVLDRTRRAGMLPGTVLWRLRGLLITAGIFGAVVTLKQLQTPDAIRRWGPEQGFATIVLVVLIGLVLALLARRLIDAARGQALEAPSDRALAIAAGALLLVGVSGVVWSPFPQGLLVPGVVLGIIAVVGMLVKATSEGIYEPPGTAADAPTSLGSLTDLPGSTAMPGLLAVTPPILLAVGASSASLPQTVYHHPTEPWLLFAVLVLIVVVPAVAASYLYSVVGSARATGVLIAMGGNARFFVLAAIVGVYVWWRSVAAPWSFPQALGALGVTAVFLAFVALVLSALTMSALRRPPPLALRVTGFRQSPLLAFVLVWILLAGMVDRADYHDVRLIEGTAAWTTVTPQQAVETWFEQAATNNPELVHPMLFVTANGGGIKAAVWGALVLDCVLGTASGIHDEEVRTFCRDELNLGAEDRWASSVFAASGVSGGSVGLAAYSASASRGQEWVWSTLGDDFISPTLSWQMFVEIPRALLQFGDGGGMDRAEVLERSWERAPRHLGQVKLLWSALLAGDDVYSGDLGTPFLGSNGTAPQPPYLVLNGTSVEDGCRFVVSNIRLTSSTRGPSCTSILQLGEEAGTDEVSSATRDAVPFLCTPSTNERRDIAMSTAALLSARFPFVSPSGRLQACRGDTKESGEQSDIFVHVVDGGYGDNSGGASIADLWRNAEPTVIEQIRTTDPCVVPMMLQIDSGYGPTPQSKTEDVAELRVPLIASSTARSIRTIEGRDEAALPFRLAFAASHGITDRHAVAFLRTNPEGEAALGWTMDDSTRTQLERQLLSNREELLRVASWFRTPC